MSTELDPVVGNWYRHTDKGQLFSVVAIDEEAGVIELQHFDGDLEEVETPAWYEMKLEAAEAPEDWTGPVDDVERDDLQYSETDMTSADWRGPLQEMPPPAEEPWEDESAEVEPDDRVVATPSEETEPQQEIEERAAKSVWAEGGAGSREVSADDIEAEPRE